MILKERLRFSNSNELRLKLIRKHDSDDRTYNLSPASEVAAHIVGDFDMSTSERDIIVENIFELLQHIDDLHPLYLPMQYPLLFPYERMDQRHQFNMILKAGKFSQQFMVDAFTSTRQRQGTFYIYRQKNYPSSSFTGGERYSRENFQDAMTICTSTSFPYLFVAFTCNPCWPELGKLFKELDCKAEDRPNLVSRIFKIKLNKLIRDITKDMLFGSVIFAEILNREAHPELCEAVKNFMIHNPCGSARKSLECMVNGKCSKHFTKKFTDRTSLDEDWYCKYRRRDTGNVMVKNGIELTI
ncbi:uncharacterized protein G2W53_007557 [Senna tora]|uniref:Helitron helicase-like domain-containing protein n=1 Tax=Senna tora TaxID=362788 RepID=A0A834X700_9FABA|nr:uncharacterized protein G2W53_007557 [Senna tora]